ncbi:hypothetical protein SAY87_000150 [Trapa incisa]|uniref:Uncharacterized protein n=1 Tax=Trapa incisa TaxID=236973 RepID=A0AAN7JFZ9_9MYRT|nr:hypothetical protein SAY87_000150 [Trapa incisa]
MQGLSIFLSAAPGPGHQAQASENEFLSDRASMREKNCDRQKNGETEERVGEGGGTEIEGAVLAQAMAARESGGISFSHKLMNLFSYVENLPVFFHTWLVLFRDKTCVSNSIHPWKKGALIQWLFCELMALTMKQASLSVAAMGLISFILGVLAENTKPPSGTPITGKDVVICKYPADPSVYLGYLSVIFLIGSTVMGYRSLFYPYEGKSVPCSALFQTNIVFVFFNISLFTAGLGLTMLLHPTITGHLHRIRNVHRDLETHCPTAKTGVFGGGAFLSLDATLFWLLLLMLISNAREDYFQEEAEEEIKADSAYDQESLGSM